MNRNVLLHECQEEQSPYSEAYRILRTNLLFSRVDGPLKKILFTSSIAQEGKSISTANTAFSLARIGKRVIVLDCDLRKPAQHLIFGRVANGLTDALFGDIPITSLIQETDVENLRLVASGPIPPNPSELLASSKMQRVLDELSSAADFVLIDSPPVLPVTDACIITSRVDGVVLVLGADMVTSEMARAAKENLDKVAARLLGVVLNKVSRDDTQAYYYNYHG